MTFVADTCVAVFRVAVTQMDAIQPPSLNLNSLKFFHFGSLDQLFGSDHFCRQPTQTTVQNHAKSLQRNPGQIRSMLALLLVNAQTNKSKPRKSIQVISNPSFTLKAQVLGKGKLLAKKSRKTHNNRQSII